MLETPGACRFLQQHSLQLHDHFLRERATEFYQISIGLKVTVNHRVAYFAMPKNYFTRTRGNPISGFVWRRGSQSEYDDILSGRFRNESLGWYNQATDPNGQRNAQETLSKNGIAYYDWANHTKQDMGFVVPISNQNSESLGRIPEMTEEPATF